ncbi:dipeptidyl-peptidase 4 [Phlyctema vagabunda]|uniref:dipeptidyl-peptidase IV n=1 Tax=Phlyctema vagabunda TaxID=108571 RepID=A0ABR4PCE1_9HELO
MWTRLALLALALSASNIHASPVAPRNETSKKVVSFADAFSGNFTVSRTSLQWIAQGEDGTYVDTDAESGDLIFANIVTGNSTTFVAASDIGSDAQDFYDYSIQSSAEHVLFITNYTKQYRHSYFADYYVFNVETKTTVPLVEDQVGDIQYAAWSPVGDTVAYVRGNNLFIWENGTSTQITEDGGPDVFNAVPDWVYEEEIFGDKYTLWFSPDGEQLAFLRFNETGVETYQVPYYMAHGSTAPPYPEYLELRYPKVGSTNPTVTLHLLDLTNLSAGPSKVEFESFEPEDLVAGEVAWVTDTHTQVIYRTFNRVQDQEKLILVDVPTLSASVVRERDARPGWIDNNLAIQYIPGTDSYVDLSDENGWQHLYLYSVNGSEPLNAITTGEWEVTAVLNINPETKTIYYQSTERDSTERHIYSVSLDGTKKKAVVDDSKAGSWTASFSAGGSYYILSYNGPELPNQKLYAINSTTTALQTINDNAKLASKLSQYTLPKVSWTTIDHPDGYSFNVMERLPPNFDSSKKYPVVFDPYGGPGSQQTTKTFRQVDFRAYLASDPELEYVILSVDNRGTGYKGRDFRTVVSGKLGTYEALDQVYAAQQWAKKEYVDSTKIAIMGWSYGGYLAAKVLELDSDAFSFALITAPVSDWQFYDSMYTERYMKTLEANAGGYNTTAVRKTAGFQHARGGFLIQHGTGDDNVHFQNSAVLVDTLTAGRVSPNKMHVQWFTDSDHSINFHGATQFVYKQMAQYLYAEKVRSEDEVLVHQFDKRHG